MTVMTKREAAYFLRVSLRTLDRFRMTKLLPSFKVRGIVRLRQEDVENFLIRHSTVVQPGRNASSPDESGV